MPKWMRINTHETNAKISIDKAILTIDNNGIVGTNNGLPFSGQPALFPESQAMAILIAWNYILSYGLDKLPHPELIDKNVLEWFNNKEYTHPEINSQ